MRGKCDLKGSKADNLAAVERHIKNSKILPQIVFTVREWEDNPGNILSKVNEKKKQWNTLSNNLAVRSSAYDEDKEKFSNAGHYKSVLNVSEDELAGAISEVTKEYKRDAKYYDNQVLVQPCLDNIRISGVVFNVDPNSLGNYYVINYATNDSTIITSGKKCLNQKHYVCFHQTDCQNPELKMLIESVKEIENIVNADALDVEFAILLSGEIYILQVRELYLRDKKVSVTEQSSILQHIYTFIKRSQHKHPFLYGESSIYSVMSDWNPAEMIGIHPKPLALSLYKEVITDSIWAYQRDNYGYMNLRSFPLMIELEGFPYIDTRISFNSFLPKDLPPKICEKLVNYYLKKLRENPEKHDKIEFDIIFSCYVFDMEERISVLKEEGFSLDEINVLCASLKKLTNNIINNGDATWKNDLEKIQILDRRNKKIMESDLGKVDKAFWLMEDCKRYGTLPFAGLARAAFIAIQILRSLVAKDILSLEEYNIYMGQICSISSEMRKDLSALSSKENLIKYGHLRPGTYEITSERYDENPELYLASTQISFKNIEYFKLSLLQMKKIQSEINIQGLGISVLELFDFIETAIKGREYAKFVFSKNISDFLLLIEHYGEELGISRDELSFISVDLVKRLYGGCIDTYGEIRNSIDLGKKRFGRGKGITLPSVIIDADDIFEFFNAQSLPNFVTLDKVVSEIVVLDPSYDKIADGAILDGKIVVIESADPGYDWIFTRKIRGLITMWGGANSHMAIRAGEMGIPGAIGVGKEIYSQIYQARVVEINALQKRIEVIR